jgi:N-acetylneuraminic acid mutarotase
MKTISEYITLLGTIKNTMTSKLNGHGLNTTGNTMLQMANKIGDIESGVRLNIFSQTTEPTTYDGIWINTDQTVNKLAQVEDFLSEWNSTYIVMPYNVYFINAVTIDNKVYIIGGKNASGTTLNNTLIYDMTTNVWSEGATMPVAKNLFGMNIYNRKIYCFGGNIGSDVISSIHIYDIDDDSWITNSISLPAARYSFNSVINNDDVYIIAGADSSYNSANTNYKYNITNNNFTTMASMPSSRAYAGYCVDGDNIYVGGGAISTSTYSNMYIYSISGNSWTSGTSMPSSKRNIKFTPQNGNIYTFCGSTTNVNEVNTNNIYSISDNSWTLATTAPYATSNYATCIRNNIIYLFGGGYSNGTAKNKVMLYSLSGGINISLYNSDTLVLQNVNSVQPYSTILTTSNTFIGSYKIQFTDVAINSINADIYYGDGSQWIKIKSAT